VVTVVITVYLLQHVHGEESSSSEEENDEMSKILDQQVRQEIEMAKLDTEREDEAREITKEEKEEQDTTMDCIKYTDTEDVESCFIDKCKAVCVAVNIKVTHQTENVAEGCNSGCKDQIYTFRSIQAPYPNTSPKLLLGTAVDKCWDGCIVQYTGYKQTSCISGCEAMRKIQLGAENSRVEEESELNAENNKNELAPQVKVESANDDVEADKKLDDTNDDVKAEDENIFYEANNDKKNIVQEVVEPNHVVRTYVLYHPLGQAEEDPSQQNAYQTYNMMMYMVKKMFQRMEMMDSVQDTDNKKMSRGWKDDRKQLKLPLFQPRASAYTSQEVDDTDDVYNKVVESLGKLKANIEGTISQPQFKENLFYILMAISCFLLLTALYDNCTETEDEDTDTQDDSAVTVKLPSYEDCIKNDAYITVDITDTKHREDPKNDKVGEENLTKVNLSLSVVVEDDQMEKK